MEDEDELAMIQEAMGGQAPGAMPFQPMPMPMPATPSQELMPPTAQGGIDDIVQQAMNTRGPYDRPDRPGRPAGEGGGGGGGNVVKFPDKQGQGYRVYDEFTGEWVGRMYNYRQRREAEEALRQLQRRTGTRDMRYNLQPFFPEE